MRWNSRMPCRVSSAAIEALAADWVIFRLWAARVTCRLSATATKMRSCSSVIGCRQPPSWSEHRLDQPEAEQRDEQRRGGAERQRAQALGPQLADEIGRAPCRANGCQYVWM